MGLGLVNISIDRVLSAFGNIISKRLEELGYRGLYRFRVYAIRVGDENTYRYKVLLGDDGFKEFCGSDRVMREVLNGIYYVLLEVRMEFRCRSAIADFAIEVSNCVVVNIKLKS